MTFPLLVRPESLPEGALLIDARAGDDAAERFKERHLAGARRVDLDSDLSAPADPAFGGRHPLPSLDAWAKTLGRLGITPDAVVVVYDDQGGANAAARFWWMLSAVGHAKVAVLSGGWEAALEAGLPTESGEDTGPSCDPYPVTRWKRPLATLDDVVDHMADPSWLLLDVREVGRHRGELEPFDPIPGAIPGAKNLPYTENLGRNREFLDPATLAARYREVLGAVSPERLVVHCGSGVTACQAILAMEHAGLAGAHLYVGSWSEWCRRMDPADR